MQFLNLGQAASQEDGCKGCRNRRKRDKRRSRGPRTRSQTDERAYKQTKSLWKPKPTENCWPLARRGEINNLSVSRKREEPGQLVCSPASRNYLCIRHCPLSPSIVFLSSSSPPREQHCAMPKQPSECCYYQNVSPLRRDPPFLSLFRHASSYRRSYKIALVNSRRLPAPSDDILRASTELDPGDCL